MPEIVGGNLEDTTFKIVHRRDLTVAQNSDIDQLVEESVTSDYGQRSQDEIDHLVKEASAMRMSRRGPRVFSETPGQSHARDLSVLAIGGDGNLKAYLATADNASSRLPEIIRKNLSEDDNHVLGAPERMAKLYLPSDRFIASRWHRYGLRAVKPELLSREGWGTDQVSLLDIMGYLALDNKFQTQPVSTFPWEGESKWPAVAASWGLEFTDDPAKDVYPFGDDKKAVVQKRMTADSVSEVREKILEKVDAQEVITRATVEIL